MHHATNDLVPVPCVLMRGGTSKGPLFLARDVPADPAQRDRFLLAALGSPHPRQVDGVGGGDPLSSKVCIVGPREADDADVQFLFCQVSVDRAEVDTSPTCGNMTTAVGAFAIESGLVPVSGDETVVRVRNLNVGALVDVAVPTPGGRVTYSGDTAIDGVPGTAACIVLRFREIMGSKSGRLLPTGHPMEEIDGVAVTCMDAAMPMVLMRAADVGCSGYETKGELDRDRELLERIDRIRLQAGERMGLGDCRGKVTPKVGLLAAPRNGGTVSSRYFVPHACHAAHAVTGAICVAACTAMAGSIADGLAVIEPAECQWLTIEHPSGSIAVELTVSGEGSDMAVVSGGVVRTARRLFEGNVLVPASAASGS